MTPKSVRCRWILDVVDADHSFSVVSWHEDDDLVRLYIDLTGGSVRSLQRDLDSLVRDEQLIRVPSGLRCAETGRQTPMAFVRP